MRAHLQASGYQVPSSVQIGLLPYLPTDKLLDEQVGVYRVALMADMEGQEELLDGLVCHPYPGPMSSDVHHRLIYVDARHHASIYIEPVTDGGQLLKPLPYGH